MELVFVYTCDRCLRDNVRYEDWFPIAFNHHWCRGCVTQSFRELPQSEQERARRWRDNDWDDARPPAKPRLPFWSWSVRGSLKEQWAAALADPGFWLLVMGLLALFVWGQSQ